MKSMNRQFGKLMGKGQGDTAKVSVLIADYEDADKTLNKVGILLTRAGCNNTDFSG
jgi:amphiphysin